MDYFNCLERFRVGSAPLQRHPWLGFGHGTQLSCGFFDYPFQYGYSRERVVKLRTSNAAPESKSTDSTSELAMLQSWLVFGALEDALGQRLHMDSFLHHSAKGAAINMKCLPSAVAEWSLTLPSLSQSRHREIDLKIETILAEMRHWCLTLSCWSTQVQWDQMYEIAKPDPVESFQSFDYNLERLGCIISIVGEILTTSKSFLRPFLRNDEVTIGFIGEYTGPAKVRLLWQVVSAGWCPFMARVLMRLGYSVAEFARFWPSMIPKFEAKRHQKCTPVRCTAYNVDTDNYQTRHICTSIQNCTTVHTQSLLLDTRLILYDGGIPVVAMKTAKSQTGKTYVELIVSDALTETPPLRYAAFSHVWSDGLGSTTEYGLPGCRLKSLFESAAALDCEHIWIDSLCVPAAVTPRKVAIQSMAEIYKSATVTIVIDRTLMSFQAGYELQRSNLELVLLRLATSPWMQRLWTLQEAVLSQRLVFCFADCMLEDRQLEGFMFKAWRTQINPINRILGREIVRVISKNGTSSRGTTPASLGDVAQMLRFRSTSKASDETLAIAGILVVDSKELLQFSSEDRMKHLFCKLKFLPSSIVFLNGPRMSERGWRWAIRSFLPYDKIGGAAQYTAAFGTTRFVGEEQAECLQNGGLAASFTVVRLDSPGTLQDELWSDGNIHGVVIKGKGFFWKVIPSSTAPLDRMSFSFDAILTTSLQQRQGDLWLGIAVTNEPLTQIPAPAEPKRYVFRRLLIIRDMQKTPDPSGKGMNYVRGEKFTDCSIVLT